MLWTAPPPAVSAMNVGAVNYRRGYGWQRGVPYGPGTKFFEVILAWNKAQIYARTIAYFAERLDVIQ